MLILPALILQQASVPAKAVPAPALTIKAIKTVPEIRPVAIAPAPTGSRFAVALEDGSVRIIDAATRATVRTLAKHPQAAYAITWSADGAWLATGDESARVWVQDTRNGTLVREYRTQGRGIQKLSFDSTRLLLASTSKDDSIHVYDLADAKKKDEKVKILGKGANLYGATFSTREPTELVTGILADAGRIYNGRTGAPLTFLSYPGSQGSYDTAINPAGTRIAVAGRDGMVSVWDAKTRKRVAGYRGHTDWVVNVAFSPNGKLIASGSTDRTVKVWNLDSSQKVADLADQSSVGSPVAFTGDGKYLISVDIMGSLVVNAVTPPAVVPAPVKKPAPKRPAPRRTGRTRG